MGKNKKKQNKKITIESSKFLSPTELKEYSQLWPLWPKLYLFSKIEAPYYFVIIIILFVCFSDLKIGVLLNSAILICQKWFENKYR